MPRINIFPLILLIALAGACTTDISQDDPLKLSWEKIEEQAKDGQLTMMMWMGDPLINDYMNEYVVPEVKQRFNIDLNIVNGQGAQVVSTLMSELEGGRQVSQIDMMWINGETFYQLRQIDALYGPFTDKLPNFRFVNFDNPFIGIDFQQLVDGYEAPWGNVQFTLIYNWDLVEDPPQNFEDLEQWVHQHPGKFTIPTEFTGMTLLKSLMISLAEDPQIFHGTFDEEVYSKFSNELWNRLNNLKTDFWRSGSTFPNNLAQLHQLYANGEVAFTMSNNDSEVDNKVNQGIFPESSIAYVPESGTIQNSHYLGISKGSPNKAEAMTVINFLLSPEAQFEKMKPSVWGDGTVLSMQSLPEEWQQKFRDIPGRKRAPKRELIQEKALMEPAPEYMIRLFEDFREKVINE